MHADIRAILAGYLRNLRALSALFCNNSAIICGFICNNICIYDNYHNYLLRAFYIASLFIDNKFMSDDYIMKNIYYQNNRYMLITSESYSLYYG